MSEFGRGYAVCLIQFLWHEPRLAEYVEDYTKYEQLHPGLFGAARGVEMWADGAVDHLFDMVRPRRFVSRRDWAQAVALRDAMTAAKWARLEGPTATEGEIRDWLATAATLLSEYARWASVETPQTFAEAWSLDEAAGLKPQRGDAATCERPIPTRKPVPA